MWSPVCTILNFSGCWYCRGNPRGSAYFNAGSVVFSKSDSEPLLDQIARRSASQARMEGYGHGISHLERSSTPPSLGQDSRGTGLQKPLPARAVGIHGLNTDLHMRIAPDELGNGRLHRRLLLPVIYQCAAVVRQGWNGHQKGAGGNGQHAEQAKLLEAARHGASNQ